MSLPKADFGVHGVCYCKDVPSKEARVSHACQRWARRNNIFAFVKIVPSINNAQTNVKNDDRRRETHGLRVSRPAFIAATEAFNPKQQARFRKWHEEVTAYGIASVRTGIDVVNEVWKVGPSRAKRHTSLWRTIIARTGDSLMLS